MLKIAIAGITGVLLAIQVKGTKTEYGQYLGIAVCVLIFYFVVSKLGVIVEALQKIQGYLSINTAYISTLIKMIGITYIAEFSSAICKDAGYQAIAGQIEIFAKLTILAVSMPILLALLDTMNQFLV